MGARFDETVSSRIQLNRRFSFTVGEAAVVIVIGAFALFARVVLLGHVSGDYTQFLSGWFDALKEAGGLPGIGLSLGDYTPPYILLLSLLTYLPLHSLYSIKLVSILFDFLLAVTAMRTVSSCGRSHTAAIAAYTAVLFAPTALLNGAFWAQCDSIFTTFLLLSLCSYLKERPFAGTVYFGIAFCLKLQAVFFAPLLVFLWYKDKIKLRYALIVPGVYLLSILPSWIAGRPLGELLTIYLKQSGQYPQICLNAPSLYIFIEEDRSETLSMAAIFLCAALMLLCLYLLYVRRFTLTRRLMVSVALFFAILLPYFLPHMHERYFYVADILAIIYAVLYPRRFYLPLLVVGASTAAYLPFLFGHEPFDLRIASLFMLLALILVGIHLFRQVWQEGKPAWPVWGKGAASVPAESERGREGKR